MNISVHFLCIVLNYFLVPSGVLKPSIASTAAKGANMKQTVASTGTKAGQHHVP